MLNRSLKMMTSNILRPSNYAALVRAVQVYERPLAALSRYFLGWGGEISLFSASENADRPSGCHSFQLP